MRHLKIVLVALSLVAGLSAASAQAVTLQIGSNAPVNSPWDLGVKRIAAEWSRISEGRVKVVFPKSVANSSMEDLIQKLKFTLDGAVLDTSGLGVIDKDVFFLSMPSVIRDDAEFDAAIAAVLPILRKRLGDRYEIVAVAKAGWIRFFSNRPLRSPEDLRNLRMGVNRNMDALTKVMQSLGVRTVQADSASTLLQFNSGAMDAMYSSPLFVGALWSQYRRVVTHMTGFKVAPFFGAIIVNRRSWDRVPEALKPALREAAESICRDIGNEAARLEDEGITAMMRGGLQVPPYAQADAAAWNELFSSTVEGFMADWYSREFTAAVYEAIGR